MLGKLKKKVVCSVLRVLELLVIEVAQLLAYSCPVTALVKLVAFVFILVWSEGSGGILSLERWQRKT